MAKPIDVRDLMKYVAGSTLAPGVRDEINRQVNIAGSPVQLWVAEFDAKIREPFMVDWKAIGAFPAEGETQDTQLDEVLIRSTMRDEHDPRSRRPMRRVIGLLTLAALLIVSASFWLLWPAGHGNTIASLYDGTHLIEFDIKGNSSGLERLPREWRERVERVVHTGDWGFPKTLSNLWKGARGEPEVYTGSALVHPVGTIVRTDQPVFEWKPLEGAEAYRLHVYDAQGDQAAESEVVSKTVWRPSKPLDRNKVYMWNVEAVRGGASLWAPKSGPMPMFMIMGLEELKGLRQAENAIGESHLGRAALFVHKGLLEDAEREVQILAAANPDSSLVRDLSTKLQALPFGTPR